MGERLTLPENFNEGLSGKTYAAWADPDQRFAADGETGVVYQISADRQDGTQMALPKGGVALSMMLATYHNPNIKDMIRWQ